MGELGIGRCEQGVVLSDEHGGDQRVVALGRGPQGTCVLYGTRGDQTRNAKPGRGLMAPRVAICAGHEANLILKLLVDVL